MQFFFKHRTCIIRYRMSVVTSHLKMARLSDHSTRGRRRFSFGRSLMKCCPANTSTAYRPQNTNDLLLQANRKAIILEKI